uniref:Integrase catalytic domain-containing protein n=1 Tax=Tanacetum cinerariifolium TaxID=118510 RepID=A0A6L2J8Q4_TANCI|nr:hypothetical protein [Tanacetum cinerariifolium]
MSMSVQLSQAQDGERPQDDDYRLLLADDLKEAQDHAQVELRNKLKIKDQRSLHQSCSKHMTEDRSRLINFVKKFIGTVRFGNDHFGAIMGYGDYVIGGSVISRANAVKVFMDDFSIFGRSFDHCLNDLDKMLQRCKDAHLILNWEKCHFMVKEGIVLGHKVFEASLKFNKAKIDVITKLPPPINIKVGAILGKKEGKNFHPIYFASKTLNTAHQNYTITEKELMAIVFALDKFQSYLVLSKTIVHTDHSALRHLFKKQDAKPRLIRRILLLQEFDIKIKDRKAKEKKFSDIKHYFWEEPYLFKVCSNDMIKRCTSGPETRTILDQCNHGPTGGHYGSNTTAKKFLDSGFYWLTIIKEANTQVRICEACQNTGNISKHYEIPLKNVQVCEIFHIWGIDFMGPFSKSYKFEYILVAVGYVSKWAEAQALPTNDARVVITFLKKLFCRFGMPKALINDKGTHFCNKIMEKTMKRYGVNHLFSTSYHPQTNGQVENTNRALKRILEKTV